MKVYYMGKLIQPNQYTRFQRIKMKVKYFFKTLAILLGKMSLTATVIVMIYMAGQVSSPVHVLAEQVNQDRLPQKIESMKSEMVDEIARLETQGAKTEDGLIVFDDNKSGTLARKDKVSIGCMQFKVGTVQHYSKQLYGKELNNYEATLLALDCSKAKELAKEVIFKVKGGIFSWSVATKEMATKVEIIRQLEQ